MHRSANLRNAYGPTETTIWSALHQLQSSEIPVPIGGPIAGDRINGESAEIIGFLFQPGQMMSNVCKRRRLKECCKLQKYDCGMVQWYVRHMFSMFSSSECVEFAARLRAFCLCGVQRRRLHTTRHAALGAMQCHSVWL